MKQALKQILAGVVVGYVLGTANIAYAGNNDGDICNCLQQEKPSNECKKFMASDAASVCGLVSLHYRITLLEKTVKSMQRKSKKSK